MPEGGDAGTALTVTWEAPRELRRIAVIGRFDPLAARRLAARMPCSWCASTKSTIPASCRAAPTPAITLMEDVHRPDAAESASMINEPQCSRDFVAVVRARGVALCEMRHASVYRLADVAYVLLHHASAPLNVIDVAFAEDFRAALAACTTACRTAQVGVLVLLSAKQRDFVVGADIKTEVRPAGLVRAWVPRGTH